MGFDNDTTAQQNVGPAQRGAQNLDAQLRRRESSEDDSVFLELILTGDERCVEDWPVGSPELDPNFRPSGSLRLRRESLRFNSLEDVIPELTKKKSSKRRTLRRFKSKTKTAAQQNQEPQGAASTDVSSASSVVGDTSQPVQLQSTDLSGATSPDLPVPAVQPGANLQTNHQSTILTRPSSRSSMSSVTSNPWDNFGVSSEDNASVNSVVISDPNPPGLSSYRSTSVVHSAAVNPLPTISEADNRQHLNSQTGALPRNNLAAAPTNPAVHLQDDAAVAAMGDWLVAQMDEINRAREAEEEEEDGDTDSLLEWWYTVEEWNQVPLELENMYSREEESRMFSSLINKVHRSLILFYRVFTECAETLWQSVFILHTVADQIKKFHRGATIASITGGVAIGLGGVAMLVGIILAPVTLGFSLIATVAGLGVATAGGATIGTAVGTDKANDKRKRKKAAAILVDNENYLLELQKILKFIITGLSRLRDHPVILFRGGFIGDQKEIQRAIQMQRLLPTPVSQALNVTTRAINAVQGMFSGVNRYFDPGQRKLKKSYITVIVAEIKQAGEALHSCIVELNNIKNQLQVATERCGLAE